MNKYCISMMSMHKYKYEKLYFFHSTLYAGIRPIEQSRCDMTIVMSAQRPADVTLQNFWLFVQSSFASRSEKLK